MSVIDEILEFLEMILWFYVACVPLVIRYVVLALLFNSIDL